MSDSRPNMIIIGANLYLCHTQAGFRKAFKHYFDSWEHKPSEVQSWPTKYPSVVSFYTEYMGTYYPYADCTPVNKYLARITELFFKVSKEG